MNTVTGLNFYPLAGAQALEQSAIIVTAAGIDGDRQYVVYDPTATISVKDPVSGLDVSTYPMVNQKMFGALATVKAEYANWGGLEVRVLDRLINVPNPYYSSKAFATLVMQYGDVVPCVSAGDEVSARISEALGSRTLALAVKSREWLDGGIVAPKDRNVAPIHIINQASVAALQAAAGASAVFGAERFKAGIVVKGPEPYEEDSWVGQDGQIGYVPVRFHRPTSRCKITGIRQTDGALVGDVPRILSQRSRTPGMGDFGIYAYPLLDQYQSRFISLGDEVFVGSA